jgi:hypothetical protein
MTGQEKSEVEVEGGLLVCLLIVDEGKKAIMGWKLLSIYAKTGAALCVNVVIGEDFVPSLWKYSLERRVTASLCWCGVPFHCAFTGIRVARQPCECFLQSRYVSDQVIAFGRGPAQLNFLTLSPGQH